MKYIKFIVGGKLILLLLSSCYSNRYLKKVTNHIEEFSEAVTCLKENSYFFKQDTIFLRKDTPLSISPSACWYPENSRDLLLKNLFSDYNLKRICYDKQKNHLFDSVISFHRDFNPILGDAVIIFYDYGNSNLRNRIISGEPLGNEKFKIINDFFIYRINRKPALGE